MLPSLGVLSITEWGLPRATSISEPSRRQKQLIKVPAEGRTCPSYIPKKIISQKKHLYLEAAKGTHPNDSGDWRLPGSPHTTFLVS